MAKALIIQAANAIYSVDDEDKYCFDGKREITNDELETICALLQSFKPQDSFEALFAAQIVVSHMLGMRKIAKSAYEEQRIGLKLLRFSSEALCKLQQKRSGGMKNVTVNYNYNGKDPVHAPVIIPTEQIDYAD